MKEIYAFPAKGGGIQVIVGVDGWMNLINSHPNFDGMEFEDHREGKKVEAITCRMYRKDRNHPIEVTEYMAECRRGTDVWNQWPIRMLRPQGSHSGRTLCLWLLQHHGARRSRKGNLASSKG